MGLPLGPTMANIFMCHHESIWLDNCPLAFKSLHYYRYIDDTCLIFKRKCDVSKFFEYLNSQHRAIKFTVEHENDNSIPFLDVNVTRKDNLISTSVFRKNTFSGQGISFFSYCCTKFKINAINTVLHRAYNICSSNLSLHQEIQFLQNFFETNGFPRNLFCSQVEKFFAKKLDFKEPLVSVPRKQTFFSMQYFGHKSVLFKIELTNLIAEYFYHLQPNLVLTNNFRIGSFFTFKDSLPISMRSSVIHKYCCPRNCGYVYVGSTCRTLRVRASEHRGFSPSS